MNQRAEAYSQPDTRATKRLRAGGLTATLDLGEGSPSLRDVSIGGHLALLRVYVAVREAGWGTVAGELTRVDVADAEGGFQVTATARHLGAGIDVTCSITLIGRPGTLHCSLLAVANTDFDTNRIGFCLLHPLSVAGVPVRVRSGRDERTEMARFPEGITGEQPIPGMTDMVGLRYPLRPGLDIDLGFEGELFEAEDQRAWTDASFKTFCTPLHLPHPRRVVRGDDIMQQVTLRYDPALTSAVTAPSARSIVRIHRGEALPALPAIGLGACEDKAPLTKAEIALIAAIAPAHLHVEIDADSDDWRGTLDRAGAEASALDTVLHVALTVSAVGQVADVVAAMATYPVTRLLPVLRGRWVSTAELLDAARAAVARHGAMFELLGGTTADFAQLAMNSPSLDGVAAVVYSINPQVHAFDDVSILQTVQAQPATVTAARQLAAGRPLIVGPVTLSQRFNPFAVDLPTMGPGLPPGVDVRQRHPLAAVWLLGSIAALSGADEMTVMASAGLKGLVARADPDLGHPDFGARPFEVYPVHAAMLDLVTFRGRARWAVETPPGLAVIAVASDVLLANLSPLPVVVDLDHLIDVALAGYEWRVVRVDKGVHEATVVRHGRRGLH